MSRNRFTVILSNLHVNDNSIYISRNEPGHHPMHKIRHFLEHLLTHFPTSFSPYENLTIDEGVCGFRGRVIFRVCIKNKPDKYGITMFTVCVSLRQVMFCVLKCTLVKVNRTSQSLNCLRDYCLVIFIRGIWFSWTDFTVHQLFLISCGQEDQSCRYMPNQKELQRQVLCQKTEKRSFVFEMEGY